MKQQSFLNDYANIAEIHAIRLQEALHEISHLMPLTTDKLEQLNSNQVAFFDMLITRFSKLQDTIGARVFSLILEILGEEDLAFIDKLNKLEKLGYLHDPNWWLDLREIRNQVTHDYPNDYPAMAAHLTVLILKANELLEFWGKLKAIISAQRLAKL